MVSVSSVHTVPVPVARPVDEPLKFSASKAKLIQKKCTKVNHRESSCTVKPGAWMVHQMKHAEDRMHGDSICGDFENLLFDLKDTKRGLRKERNENLSIWSTSRESGEIFEEEEIDEEQQKAEEEWQESLNQSSSMLDLVLANFIIDAGPLGCRCGIALGTANWESSAFGCSRLICCTTHRALGLKLIRCDLPVVPATLSASFWC